MAAGFKRAGNILVQAAKELGYSGATALDEKKLVQQEERSLAAMLAESGSRVAEAVRGGDFDTAIAIVARFREPIDRFFDGVMVLSDQVELRDNRLALLQQLVGVFGLVGDLSLIQTEPEGSAPVP